MTTVPLATFVLALYIATNIAPNIVPNVVPRWEKTLNIPLDSSCSSSSRSAAVVDGCGGGVAVPAEGGADRLVDLTFFLRFFSTVSDLPFEGPEEGFMFK